MLVASVAFIFAKKNLGGVIKYLSAVNIVEVEVRIFGEPFL
jgi:hypothetical protein